MTLRAWATPVVIGAFLVMAVTGSLMFFHLNTGTMKPIHEWAGLVMVGAGVAHIVVNWRAFSLYFRRPLASAIMGVGAVVLGVSMVPGLLGNGPGGGASVRAIIGSLGQARVEQLAALTEQAPDAVVSALRAKGYDGASAERSVAAIAENDMETQGAILRAIFEVNEKGTGTGAGGAGQGQGRPAVVTN